MEQRKNDKNRKKKRIDLSHSFSDEETPCFSEPSFKTKLSLTVSGGVGLSLRSILSYFMMTAGDNLLTD
jgi:hypothetical protein